MGEVIEAPLTSVRKDIKEMKERITALSSLSEQHAMAFLELAKSHNALTVTSQKIARSIISSIEEMKDSLTILEDRLELIEEKMKSNKIW